MVGNGHNYPIFPGRTLCLCGEPLTDEQLAMGQSFCNECQAEIDKDTGKLRSNGDTLA